MRTSGYFSSRIVPIQPEGDRPPLFLVHGLGGSVLAFAALSEYFDPEQPVFAIQAQGIDGRQPVQTRIEDMAETYLRAVRSVQRNGPYHLAGHDFGAHVAFEMALRLVEERQGIGSLSVIDVAAPTDEPGAAVCRGRRFSMRDSLSRYVNRAAGMLDEHGWSPLPGGLRRQLRACGDRLSWLEAERMLDLEGQPDTIKRAAELHWEAMKAYRPRVYPGMIDLFATLPFDGAAAGWARLADGGVTLHSLPGSHKDLFHEPHVRALAQALQRRLDRSGGAAVAAGASWDASKGLVERAS